MSSGYYTLAACIIISWWIHAIHTYTYLNTAICSNDRLVHNQTVFSSQPNDDMEYLYMEKGHSPTVAEISEQAKYHNSQR